MDADSDLSIPSKASRFLHSVQTLFRELPPHTRSATCKSIIICSLLPLTTPLVWKWSTGCPVIPWTFVYRVHRVGVEGILHGRWIDKGGGALTMQRTDHDRSHV